MPHNVQMLDIFLSSPADVEAERRFIVELAREWNALRSHGSGFYLNVLTWEDAVAPGFSERPQDVINEQIGDTYDVYLGLMWGRLGSPTGKADSGTVEEFERALERYRGGGAVRLAMLFKTTDIPMSQLDGAQFDLVRDFKKRFAAEGGLFVEFEDNDRLRKASSRLFEQIVTSFQEAGAPTPGPAVSDDKRRTPKKGGRKSASSTRIESPTASSPESGPSDLGLFEINDQIAEVAKEQVDFFDDLTATQEKANKVINKSAEELSGLVSLGSADPERIKQNVAQVAQALTGTAEFLEHRLPRFITGNDRLIELTEHGLDISLDFGPANTGAIELRQTINGLAQVCLVNCSRLDTLMETIRSLPRMSTEFNVARKSMLMQYGLLRDETSKLQQALLSALQKYPSGADDSGSSTVN